jgi:hypothetical protein
MYPQNIIIDSFQNTGKTETNVQWQKITRLGKM